MGEGYESKWVQPVNKKHNLATALATLLTLMGCAESAHDKAAPVTDFATATHTPQTNNRAQEHPATALGFDYLSDAQGALALGIPSTGISTHYRALPDYLLENRAKSGEKFAMTFWIERTAMEILEIQRTRRTDDLSPDVDGDPTKNFGQMSVTLNSLMQDPANAMAGYLWGLAYSASILGAPDEPIVAGIRLAGLRGDDRAAGFERQFRSTHPNLDEEKIDMYFESGRRAMEMAAVPRNP